MPRRPGTQQPDRVQMILGTAGTADRRGDLLYKDFGAPAQSAYWTSAVSGPGRYLASFTASENTLPWFAKNRVSFQIANTWFSGEPTERSRNFSEGFGEPACHSPQ